MPFLSLTIHGTHQVIHLHSRLRVEGVDWVALRLVRPLSLRCRGRPRAVGHLHVQHGHALRRPRVRPADVGVVSCNKQSV